MLRFLREGLRLPLTEPRPPADPEIAALAASLDETARRRLGHSLAIRQVDAGSCNGCELEIHALNNAFYDIERFGIHFVASPRHADVLLVTGPVTRNMRQALERTVARDTGSEMGRRGGRLRRGWRHIRREPLDRRRCGRCGAG